MPEKVYNLSIVIDAKNNASPKLQQAGKDLTGFGKAASGVNSTLGSLGLGLSMAGLVTVAGAAGTAMVKLAMDAEQTEVAFTTLIGSTAGAQEHLDELRAFAASTPFQFTDLTEASKKMMAFGFESERVIPMLTAIGDAVAAMGGTSANVDRVTLALGQMQAKGKVSAGEMLQLTEAGIPAWGYLADAIGVSTGEVMKMSERGLIPAGDAINYILAGMEKDFGGMMAAQSQTAAGKLSNLTDQLQLLGTTLGDFSLPVIGGGIEMISGRVGALNLLNQAFKDGAINVAEYGQTLFTLSVLGPDASQEIDFLTQKIADQNAVLETENQVLESSIDAHDRLAATTEVNVAGSSEFAAQTATLNTVWQSYGPTVSDAVVANYELAKSLDAINLDLLAAGLNGPIGSATENFTESQADLTTQIAEARAELERYQSQHGQTVEVTHEATASQAEYDLAVQRAAEAQAKASEATASGAENALELTVAAEKAAEKVGKLSGELGGSELVTLNYNTKIGETQEKLTALESQLAEEEAALRRTTNEFLYQQLAVEGDAEANLALARNLGILDEQSYATAEAALALKQAYEDGSLGAAGYAAKSGELADAIARLQSKKITVTVDAIFNEIRNAAISAQVDAAGAGGDEVVIEGGATGAPFSAGGAMLFNESPSTTPEVIVASQQGGGYILTRQDAQAALAGAYGRGATTYNVTINDQLAAKLFLEELRRREMVQVDGMM